MAILLDTNVLSEVLRPQPDPSVLGWLDSEPSNTLWTSAITQAEMLAGVAQLPAGRRRQSLAAEVEHLFTVEFAQRVLPFDERAAPHYARIVTLRRSGGRPISGFDAAIAAIAVSRGFVLATRNLKDFAGLDLQVVDPWMNRS